MRSSNVLRFLFFLGLIALALCQLRVALIAQTAYSDFSANKAVRDYQTEPRLLVAYGKEEMLLGNYENTRKWLQKALRSNPVYIPAWIALAELENDIGNTARALEILEYLDRLMKDVLRWRWEKTMLAYLLEREDMLKADLSWLLQQENLSWQTRKKVLDFAFFRWTEPGELVKAMGKENTIQLFLRAVQIHNIETASFLWSTTESEHEKLEKREVLQYINLLIDNQKFDDAMLIWKKYYPSDNLLYNGDFSLPLVKGGFGWRVWKSPEGVEAEIQNQDTEKTALHVHFNGKDNINFYHVLQIIPPSSSQHFVLTGAMRSKNVSTDQRPFIEIRGRECSLYTETEMVASDQDWTPFSLSFTVPDDCSQGIMLRLRRRPSRQIDSLISGDWWVTDLSLQTVPYNAPE